MRKFIFTSAALAGVIFMLQSTAPSYGDTPDIESAGKSELKLETLLKSVLAGVEGKEVIVSRVTIPPNTSLPKHWHPGEEFGYVLEGSVVLWQDGKEDIVGKKGDVV